MGALSEEDLLLAIEHIGGVSSLHISHCDYAQKTRMAIIRNDGVEVFDTHLKTSEMDRFLGTLAEITGARVTVTGFGPSSTDRRKYEVPKPAEKKDKIFQAISTT